MRFVMQAFRGVIDAERRAGWVKLANRPSRSAHFTALIRAGGAQRILLCEAGPAAAGIHREGDDGQ
jgi:hypothetical protein